MQLSVTPLRDQITAPARTILLLLLAAAAVVFVIACSNVANLILARSVRREGELAVRAALGASHGALRRTLLAESLVLCGAGAILGVAARAAARAVVARFAARFSVRALEVTVDNTVLWVGAASPWPQQCCSPTFRDCPRRSRADRLRARERQRFGSRRAPIVACAYSPRRRSPSPSCCWPAPACCVAALIALQTANTGYDTRQVLALDIPCARLRPAHSHGHNSADLYEEVTRRIRQLPGVDGVAGGTFVPWRDAGSWRPIQFTVEGYTPEDGEDNPYARDAIRRTWLLCGARNSGGRRPRIH